MIVKDLYENVTLLSPCNHHQFLVHLDTSVRTLVARYGAKHVIFTEKGKCGRDIPIPYAKPMNMDDEIPVYEAYFPAIQDNILFLLTGNADRKTDFVQEAEDAFKTVWKIKNRHKRFVDARFADHV